MGGHCRLRALSQEGVFALYFVLFFFFFYYSFLFFNDFHFYFSIVFYFFFLHWNLCFLSFNQLILLSFCLSLFIFVRCSRCTTVPRLNWDLKSRSQPHTTL